MISSHEMLVSKPKKGETKLSEIEKNIPVSASAQKVGVSVAKSKSHAAKMNENSYVTTTVYTVNNAVGVTNGRRKVLVGKLQDKEYRDAYMRATVTHGLAHQIRVNRELRNLSQQSLAAKCGGKTTQVVISRLEDPSYGKFTLNSVLKIASALDVALVVRLVPYSKFLLETADKSVMGLCAKSFSEDNLNAKQALVTFTKTEIKSQKYVVLGSTQPSTELPVVTSPSKLLKDCGYALIKSVN